MTTQRANPGGILAPDEVIGRDTLVDQLWKTLERRGLYITAERRMGKTSVVRDKMRQKMPDGWLLIYLDVSGAGTPLKFVENLLKACREHLNAATQPRITFGKLISCLTGLGLTGDVGVRLPDRIGADWKELLSSLLDDLSNSNPRVVLAFDEFPLMLDAIKRQGTGVSGEITAMELLDTLRAARQQHDLRMIYTGSLGLHHVLTTLREQGYQNDPTNDMHSVDLGPLTQQYATDLAVRLLYGENLRCESVEDVASHLAAVTDGIPFYIQHIVAEMSLRDEAVTIQLIDECLNQRFSDPFDPWRLSYYEDRIDTHYVALFRPIARAVLDQLATAHPKTIRELVEGMDPETTYGTAENVRGVVKLLGLDHFVTITEGCYAFRSPFIRRVWRSLRATGV